MAWVFHRNNDVSLLLCSHLPLLENPSTSFHYLRLVFEIKWLFVTENGRHPLLVLNCLKIEAVWRRRRGLTLTHIFMDTTNRSFLVLFVAIFLLTTILLPTFVVTLLRDLLLLSLSCIIMVIISFVVSHPHISFIDIDVGFVTDLISFQDWSNTLDFQESIFEVIML